jgi:hypothetical protein
VIVGASNNGERINMTESDNPHERERKALEDIDAVLKKLLDEPPDDADMERARSGVRELRAFLDARRSDGSEFGADNDEKVERNARLCFDRRTGTSWGDLSTKYHISVARCKQIVNAAGPRGT